MNAARPATCDAPPRNASPRIAVGAFMLESNSHAPVATREEFEAFLYLKDKDFETDWRRAAPRSPATIRGFVEAMDASGPWQAVPLLGAAVGASGSIDQAFFDEVVDGLCERLQAALPVDAVYLSLHGAAIATVDPDPDGTVLERIRRIVGAHVPVVATLDLHGNIVPRMVEEASVLVAYRCNPHTDMAERGAESAAVIREMLAGLDVSTGFVKLPMAPPSVTQNTKAGPYADLIAYGQTLLDADVLNVSILSGFTLGDTPKNGMSVIVTTRGANAASKVKAQDLARMIATRAWDERLRYVPALTSLDDATAMALACGSDPKRPALLFADVADNAGGGGRANTVWILEAFVKAGVQHCLLGLFFDRALAAQAHKEGQTRGLGAHWHASFNRDEDHPLSGRFAHEVKVLALHDGHCVGRRGMLAGQALALGPCALLQVGGVLVVVASSRQQCMDPVYFEMLGLDIGEARSVVVKSRGHFRAGFDHLFDDAHIVEVDVPGLTTPVLSRVAWQRMPRPMFPLDPDMHWSAPGSAP